MRVRIPWWPIAGAVVLGVALGVSVAAGRFWDALIVAAMLLLPLFAIAGWLLAWRRGLLDDHD